MRYIRGCSVTQIEIADDFYEAYIRCFKGNEENKIVAVPAFANGLFACELYLKCLITENKKVHNLKDLFDALDDEKKNELMEIKNNLEYTLDELLQGIGNGFEFWRYCFEDEHKEIEEKYPFLFSECFLKVYSPALKEMAHKYNKEGK